MSVSSERVKKWRKETKQMMVDSMGGKCVCCGYNRHNDALEFHHLDPDQKEHSFTRLVVNPSRWEVIVIELRKAILVCSNCHREVEAGIRLIPDGAARFDESYAVRSHRTPAPRLCLVCDGELKTFNKSVRLCSEECRGKRKAFYKRTA